MQEEQDNKVQNIAERLQPLSPSGTIPGFVPNDSPIGGNFSLNNYQPGAGDQDLDLSNFINSDDYFTNPAGSGNFTGADLDSGFPDMDLQLDGQPMDFNSGYGLDDGSNAFDVLGTGNSVAEPNIKEEDGGRVESVSSETTSQGGGSPLTSPMKKRRKS
jgi:heat shock transcription factor